MASSWAPPGAGKTSGVLTEVMAACLTHSPEDLNVVYAACTQHSVADELSQFPHVVAVASNLAEDAHQLDRLCDALSSELDRRGEMVAVLDGCPDVSDYNRRRREGTPLAPIPVLWVIVEDYDAAFADPERGKLRDLFRRIARVGRSLHVYFQLVGRTRDTQSLQGITNMLGYAIAARTATPKDSRSAIGDTAAALIAPEEQPGTAYLRTSFADPDLARRTANLRKFRYFWATDNNPIEMASTIASALRAATQNPPPPL